MKNAAVHNGVGNREQGTGNREQGTGDRLTPENETPKRQEVKHQDVKSAPWGGECAAGRWWNKELRAFARVCARLSRQS
jgi:hypothetical protein